MILARLGSISIRLNKKYINPPTIQANAYISLRNSNGTSFNNTSLITPPKQAVMVPSAMQTPTLNFLSTANSIPMIVNKPSPNASNTKSVIGSLLKNLPNSIVAMAEQKITTVAVSFLNQLTGRLPIIMSRKVPPPIAVTNARTSTPNGSNFFCMARNAPETANEKVPRISMMKRKFVGMS